MRRIFLTSTIRQSFVEEDAAILRRHFALDFLVGSGPIAALRMFVRAARADCSICWFASVYSWVVTLAARLFRKRSLVIIGGVDAAAIPELGYGIWLSGWKSRLVRRALMRADLVLVVDAGLADALRRQSGLPLHNVRVLPTGYDPEQWTPPKAETEGETGREGVLCVATCDSAQRAKVKGLDLLLKGAAEFPDLPFTVVGVAPDFIRTIPFAVPPNVRLLPPVPRDALLDHYRTARIYCQPSRHEGLPNALCEGMLCGAVPVGTRVGGMPTAIGECGIVVEPDDPDALRRGIAEGLGLPEEIGLKGRDRIIRLFPKGAREKGLIAAVKGKEIARRSLDALTEERDAE